MWRAVTHAGSACDSVGARGVLCSGGGRWNGAQDTVFTSPAYPVESTI